MTASNSSGSKGLVWVRRDLRLHDHHAMRMALKACKQVWVVFVFDTDILSHLLDRGLKKDRRIDFIWQSLQEINSELQTKGGGLIVRHGRAVEIIPQLATELGVQAVYTNKDYEPAALERDRLVSLALEAKDIAFHDYKDQVIFEHQEVLTGQGGVFSVFTPYKNAWLKKLQATDLDAHAVDLDSGQFASIPKSLNLPFPSLASMGFEPTGIESYLPTGMSGASELFEKFLDRMDQYHATRDFPAVKGPSYLSVHSRFGTISIRALVREAHHRMLAGSMGATIWLSELIWRDFYFMILSNHPRLAPALSKKSLIHGTAGHQSFKPDYDNIVWESGPKAQKLFKAWCEGKTGYPLVDAAMHQLNQSGYMHNRLRMVVACFLIKDLGIDWRWGEQYFADHLNDFDFAANNGGWQWASSSGCDAQPYFRIFNPITQSEKFDAEGKFIKKYLPQLSKLSKKAIHAPWLAGDIELDIAGVCLGRDYPAPIVQHDEARKNTLIRYAVVKKESAE
jgi:deoxyribodipyrimidine photo-lyase